MHNIDSRCDISLQVSTVTPPSVTPPVVTPPSVTPSVVTPPTVRVTNRSENCKAVNMNTDRCSRQEWEADLTVVFTANMSRLYHTPKSKDVELIYHRDETDNKIFTALIK